MYLQYTKQATYPIYKSDNICLLV